MMQFSRSFFLWIALAIAVLVIGLGIGLTGDQSQDHIDGSAGLAVEEAAQHESSGGVESGYGSDATVAEVAHAETPLQLHGAHLALRRWRAEGGQLPELSGIEDFMGSGEEYLRLNGRAIQLYGCNRFSDCGPMTFKTIEMCLEAGAQCVPGNGFLDIIATFYSPHEIDVMLDLVAQFQSAENSSRDRPHRGTG